MSGVATLSITNGVPPSISVQPVNQIVNAGASATFRVGYSGAEPLRFQWWFQSGALAQATNSILYKQFADPQ